MAQIFANDVEAADALKKSFEKLRAEIAKVVVGQDEGLAQICEESGHGRGVDGGEGRERG